MERLDEYLTNRDAAELPGVATNTLRNWDRDGKVLMCRNPTNGYRFFKRSDLEGLLKQIARSRIAPQRRKAR